MDALATFTRLRTLNWEDEFLLLNHLTIDPDESTEEQEEDNLSMCFGALGTRSRQKLGDSDSNNNKRRRPNDDDVKSIRHLLSEGHRGPFILLSCPRKSTHKSKNHDPRKMSMDSKSHQSSKSN